MRTLQSLTELIYAASNYGDGSNGLGILTEHVHALTHLGYVRTIGESQWLVPNAGGRAFPLVCSELIKVDTEDGPITGRCGIRALADTGLCAGHAAVLGVDEGEGDCEHGLSRFLCAGPGHYPTDI